MSRFRALKRTVNSIEDKEGLSVEEAMFVILVEIAGSLAVIADVLVDKDGENHDT